ncbi:hypothetical protein [Azorhizobium oxalatiphilum]|nr:hypothetical protein [Azorhizobium oxalatiphilum]
MAIATPAFSADIYTPTKNAPTCANLADLRAMAKAAKVPDREEIGRLLNGPCAMTGAGKALYVEDDVLDHALSQAFVCVREIDSKGPCKWRVGARESLK